jgi:hypothetical protein
LPPATSFPKRITRQAAYKDPQEFQEGNMPMVNQKALVLNKKPDDEVELVAISNIKKTAPSLTLSRQFRSIIANFVPIKK